MIPTRVDKNCDRCTADQMILEGYNYYVCPNCGYTVQYGASKRMKLTDGT